MSAEHTLEAATPNLNLGPEEKRTYGILFRQADTDGVGVVTGEIAVKFFEKTRLDSRVLGEIWQIADQDNRGFLTPAGFATVLRLIGHAQAGREPVPELALQQAPLPRFDGLNLGGPAPPPTSPLQAQGTGPGIRIPPLTPEKVAQYASLFERQPLQGNMLPGDQAKNIFEKSSLPNEVLGRIWQLADTEQRGALVVTEFVIAMHLLTSMKSNALKGLPNVLPAGLYEAATRRPGPPNAPPPRQSPQGTGIPPVPAIPRQLSGQAQMRQASPLGRPPLGPQSTGIPRQTTGAGQANDWLVTPADKARFDELYASLDKTNKGFITGDEAVPFLSQSNLSEDALAQVWDLADITSEGRLTPDTFAVAMFLIRQQRSNRDAPIPVTLPPNLIPPSLRTQARPQPPQVQPQVNAGPSPFDEPVPAPAPAPAPPQPKSAMDDLFGLDTPPAPQQQPLSTGGSAAKDPFAEGPATSPIRGPAQNNSFKPFVPSSSFGKTLASHDTGASASNSQQGGAAGMDDLLGADDESSKNISNDSTELANLSNQVSSLSKQMQTVQGQRATTQTELNQASEQKKNFEQRLSQLRALYEKEAKDVKTLQDQLKAIREETRKLTNEMVSIDGTHKDLTAQHQQLQTALQTDQAEQASLKQKLSTLNAEIAQLKPAIEKLKSDGRQQKGMVAIGKKQLSTAEGERDKLKAEAEELAKGGDEASRSADTSSPVISSAQVASPAASTTSANNPFFKRTGSTDVTSGYASPAPKPYGEKSFDDIFGSIGATAGSSSGTPPPVTSFKQQHTGQSSASVGSFGTPAASSPATSRQPTLNEPPPPPDSRQISSSYLPFREPPESLSSSRQVSPPVSRGGDGITAPAPVEATATGQSSGSADTKKPEAEDKLASNSNGSIPGAFPDEPSESATPNPPFGGNRDSDPFGKDVGNAKDDFDSAFASFKPQEKSKDTSSAFSPNVNTEFPPITEIEHDDESDSASEGNGFDDDFAPASPPTKQPANGEAASAPAPSSPTVTKAATSSEAPAVEGTGAQSQASKYDDQSFLSSYSYGAAHKNKNSTLSDLSAFPEPPKTSPSFPPPKSDDPFAPAATGAPSSAAPAAKGAFDDLDDEFEGLEEAKEGSADDEFANISRSNLDDFNPVFDSSPPPSQPKSESTNASTAFGMNSSYDFGNVSTTSATTAGAPAAGNSNSAGAPPAGGKAAQPSENHDWDAIFASLDAPSDVANAANLSHPAAKGAEEPGAAGPTLGQDLNRPSTGRALTDEGKHDDPIVKNLTGMGYSRADAINALEKYDYNLERAANYLASHS